jgi:O-antigen ligase
MPPYLALFLWIILLLALLRFDPARAAGTSFALWVPLIWMFIVGSRLPSQWLGSQFGTAARVLEEGNPLDRSIFTVLILMAVGILFARSFNWTGFVTRNFALVLFITFALVSVLWSDFPFVSFKRWFRDLGSYFMILVVLSDPQPFEAVRTFIRRFCYLLIPLSTLLDKYYPYLARQYGGYSGAVEFIGATTSKNMLGNVCLISGIYFFWDTVTRWSDRKDRRVKRVILLNVAFLFLTLRLLRLSSSATSTVCLAIGALIIVAVHSGWGKRRLTLIKVLIPVTLCLYAILAFGFDLNGQLAGQLGRDPSLTDRTVIWKTVLNEHTNPILGTGYESFWLGPRLQRIWQVVGNINEAHNGYLEVYLNLGVIGVGLLVGFLISGYRTICKKFESSYALASLMLSMWTVTLFYNVTEAAFKGGLLWLVLLLGVTVIPAREAAIGESLRAAKGLPKSPMRMKLQRG